MDENMDNPTPTPENQPQESAPQPEAAPQTPPPTTGDLSKDAKMWGMLCHLAALVTYIGIPFGNILGPLVIWLIKKDEFEFVNDQGKEALNFQISVTIYAVVCALLICLGGLGFILLAALGIADLVFIIIASIAANKGEAYRYPCCIRLVK